MDKIEILEQLEYEYDLLDWTINEIYIWQVIRENIYYKLDEKTKSKVSSKLNYIDIIKSFFRKNPLFSMKKKDILIFSYSSRAKVIDNRVQDMFFFKILHLFKSYEYHGYRENYKSNITLDDQIDYDNILLIAKIFRQFKKFKIDQINDKKIKFIEKEIVKKLNLHIDLKKLIINSILNFLIISDIYKFILKFKKVKKIFLINSNTFMPIIYCAKQLGIETIELQHGAMAKSQAIYTYYDLSVVRYFPDKFYYFGKFWKDNFHLPVKNSYIYGYDYLNLEYQKNKKNKKIDKTLLITSADSSVDEYLVTYLLNNYKLLKDYRIFYKKHPRDFNKESKVLEKLTIFKNSEIVTSQYGLHYLLSISQIFISVGSTTIYESLLYKCKTLILKKSNLFNNTEVLNKSKYVNIVKEDESIEKYLNNENELLEKQTIFKLRNK